ncbi:PAS domain S-box protein [Endothiovibrio diazotrophicus]
MSREKDWVERRQTLRTEADQVVAAISPARERARPADVMLHELLVHKVELEMQIEELRRAHASLEEARDRYAECCESSPMGLLTVCRDGVITESNPKGATLLGIERAKLIRSRLGRFVSPADGDRWQRVFLDVMDRPGLEEQACVVGMVRADGTPFEAYLSCRRYEPAEGPPQLRLTLFDIDQIRRAKDRAT